MYTNQYSEIIAFEGIQGALLQSYRSIFISSQSILLAVAVFIASQSQGSYFCLLLFPVGLLICVAWFLIDHNRGLHELFFDSRLLKIEKGDDVLNVWSEYYKWIDKSTKEKKEDLESGPEGERVLRIAKKLISTRGLMGILLPSLFLLLWMIMTGIVLFRYIRF